VHKDATGLDGRVVKRRFDGERAMQVSPS